MKLNTFFNNFELLADAPNGVPKLREMILQLAVQGKLTPQDTKDERASVLLEKINAEKEKLIKEKKIKKARALPPIDQDEIPYELPNRWEWVKLGDISINIHYGYTASANKKIRDVRLLRITDIQNGQVNWDNVPGCEIDKKKINHYELQSADLLIARTGGTIGKTFLVEDLPVCAVFASYLIRVIPSAQLIPRYIKCFVESPLYWKQLYAKCSGTGQPNVNATSLKALVVPLPPIQEQKCIVAKVDQLMALCDELEVRKNKRNDSRIVLNASALDRLLNAKTSNAFSKHWQRIINNFDLLYNNPGNVDRLRQAILQLAVKGKLVPQDSKDEPASVILEGMKTKLKGPVKIGRGKIFDPMQPVSNEEKPFNLPNGWEWVRLGRIVKIIGGSQPPKSTFVYESKKGYTRLIQIRDFKSDSYKTFVPDKYANRPFFKDDIMIGRYGPPIFQILRGLSGTYNVALMKADPIDNVINRDYLFYLLKESRIQNIVISESERTAGQSGVRKDLLYTFIIGLPPEAEQKRIVAKVDQLMALCDELETKLSQSQSECDELLSAIVNSIAN